ncbi:MAG: HD domain-containing protein [Victivallales bacterium]|nr:HD domain-containing protein [Victivallales bacterium]
MHRRKDKMRQLDGVYGVVDIGAHAARLGIYQHSGGNIETLENLSIPLLLGSDVFVKGVISPENIRESARILADFAEKMRECSVSDYAAFATSAVREAANQEVFIDRIERMSGLKLKVLQAAEEVKLTHMSVKERLERRLRLNSRKAVVCNIGTGASQFFLSDDGLLTNMLSLNFGTLRLREIIEQAHTGKFSIHQAMDDFTANLVETVSRLVDGQDGADTLIVTGGNARSILKISHSARKVANFASIGKKQLKQIETRISDKSPAEIAERYGISDYYATGLEPCCLFIDNLLKHFGSDKVTVVVADTRSVVLGNLLREKAGQPDLFDEDILAAARVIGRKYRFDQDHAEQVLRLALQIFDATAELHQLGAKERLLLGVASILHDIGQFVDTRQHHKHSHYLVLNSQMPGISEQELRLAAVVARYHRKALPKKSHTEYTGLQVDDQMTVSALAAILRVADALDRSHDARVALTGIDIKEKSLSLFLSSDKDVSLELLSLKRKRDLFQNHFCLAVKADVTG